MNIVQASEVYGELCWKAEIGIGSFLTLEIGDPYIWERPQCFPKICDRFGTEHRCVDVIGGWTLWIYQCKWSILRHGEAVCDSDGAREDMQSCAARLVGSEILSISWSTVDELWCVELEFGWEIRLRESPDESSPVEETKRLAILYGPDRSNVSFLASGSVSHEESGAG